MMYFWIFMGVDFFASGVVSALLMRKSAVDPESGSSFGDVPVLVWWFEQADLVVDLVYVRCGLGPAKVMAWLLGAIFVAPAIGLLLLLVTGAYLNSLADYGA